MWRQGKYTVTAIEGDGIGIEISKSVREIFAAANVFNPHPSTDRLHPNESRRQLIGNLLTSLQSSKMMDVLPFQMKQLNQSSAIKLLSKVP